MCRETMTTRDRDGGEDEGTDDELMIEFNQAIDARDRERIVYIIERLSIQVILCHLTAEPEYIQFLSDILTLKFYHVEFRDNVGILECGRIVENSRRFGHLEYQDGGCISTIKVIMSHNGLITNYLRLRKIEFETIIPEYTKSMVVQPCILPEPDELKRLTHLHRELWASCIASNNILGMKFLIEAGYRPTIVDTKTKRFPCHVYHVMMQFPEFFPGDYLFNLINSDICMQYCTRPEYHQLMETVDVRFIFNPAALRHLHNIGRVLPTCNEMLNSITDVDDSHKSHASPHASPHATSLKLIYAQSVIPYSGEFKVNNLELLLKDIEEPAVTTLMMSLLRKGIVTKDEIVNHSGVNEIVDHLIEIM